MNEAAGGPGYVPPPPFAPPAWRVAPLNELQMLGTSSYPPSLVPPAVAPPAWSPPTTIRPPRSRALAIAVASLVTAALVAIVAVLLTAGSSGRTVRSLSLPESAGDYTRISTVSGTELRNVFAGSGAFGNLAAQDLDHAKVGLYARSQQTAPSLLFVGFSATQSPVIGHELRSMEPGDVVDDVLSGAGSTGPPIPVSAGPLGGALECTQVDLDGEPATVGVWADTDTLGIVLLVDPLAPASTTRAGEITRAMRSMAEH